MPANMLYEQGREIKLGVCDVAAFGWFTQASLDSETLVIPFERVKPERVFKRQIRYIIHNCINCTKQGLDWSSRVMAPAENAERFARGYLGFLSSLRSPTPATGCCGNVRSRCPSCGREICYSPANP